MKEMKQRRKKERTWAEAARLVLENYSDAPMTPKQILQVIEAEGLKEMRSGTSPLACLNAMLHSNSRGGDGLFYKLPGRISLFTLKKDALQWSRNLSVQEGEELEDAADAESCESNEASTVSGDNDVSLDETSSNASCSAESQSKGLSTARESYRAASQTSKQKKKTGVMLPRVVLTPLKVNGAHMESASGFTGRHVDGESSSTSSSSSSSLALCGATVRSRTEINRDPPQLLRGIRKPAAGQMKRNRGEDIDFETPGSILVNTNLRALINSRTFNVLPAHFQQQLLCLLPEVDRQVGADGLMRLSGSALNNEFFTHAAQSWRERLADGEFTHEMQVRIRQEMEKEKRVEQWKEKFFEDYYGQKLGLTREESQQQNSVQDAENRTGLSVQGESSRPLRGPSTRQRDGHFKKRSRTDLRCRARRSLYKIREPEQTETTKETASVAPDSSFHREMKADADLKEDLTGSSSASLKPESSGLLVSPEASRLHSKLEDLSLAAASVNRVPSLPQENSARESKDQKRKCFEEAASASFPEKKPRLDDRQSFRNTIESVHPEKPQPTKEEPKVPPIRIQLSRIKPPWVVKGQPTYQICPRIIPNTEPPSRGRTGARTLADIKARALQARAQREAATAIGGGGGPGGGGGSSTDKGGGDSSSHTEHRRSKRTHGKCSSNLQRTQLLPPPPLEGEEANSEIAVQVANTHSSGPAKPDACAPNGEGGCLLERAADAVSGGAQLTAASAKLPRSSPLTGSSFDTATSEEQEDNSEPLLQDIRAESLCNQQECMVPRENSLSCSQAQGSVMSLVGESSIVSGHKDGSAPTELNCNPAGKETLPLQSFLTPESSPEGKEQQEPETEARFNGSDLSTGDGATNCENSKTNAVGMENMGPGLSIFTHQPAERLNENEIQNGGEQCRGSLVKPFSHDGLPSQEGIDISEGLPQLREKPPGADMKNACQQMREIQELKTNGDDETQSMHSETTETASDFEADLTDENAELEMCFKNINQEEAIGKDSSKQSQAGRFNRIGSESTVKTDSLSYVVDLPSVTVVSNESQPQRWVPRTPLTQTPEIQKKLPTPTRPMSSVEANNPLVMQLLKGNLSLEKVLPVSHASIQIEITEPRLDRSSENHSLQMERSSGSYFDQDSLQDVDINAGALSRSGDFYSRRSLGDPQKKQGNSGTALPRTEAIETPPDIPETHPKVGLNLNSQDHLGSHVRGSQKPEELGPRERKASSCSFENQKELPQVHSVPQHNPLTSVVTNKSPEKLNPPAALRFLSPNVTSLGPNQNGGTSVNKHYAGVQGKKLFGSGFPCNSPSRLHHPRALEHVPVLGTLSPSKQMPPNKSCAPGAGVPTAREEWPSKQPASTLGGIKNENILACGDPAKSNMENRKDAAPNPVELMEHLQSVPLVMDLPFFKLPREPGKGLNQPLEPSSIPSQLNIKQAFYGKLSKFQLNSTSFNFSSNTPAFPRGLAGSMMQLTHKANFAANHNASLSVQMFADSSSVEEISLKCSCSLKAMIMCKGCGAFCHDDCIGPSKLCVLCLVVR